MFLINLFMPSEEILKNSTVVNKNKFPIIIKSIIVLLVALLLLTVTLITSKKYVSAVLMIAVIALIFFSLVFLKRGKLNYYSLFLLLGFLLCEILITYSLFSTHISNPLAIYRLNVLFLALFLFNSILLVSQKQNIVFCISSIAVWIVAMCIAYPKMVATDFSLTLQANIYSALALLVAVASSIISFSFRNKIVGVLENQRFYS